MNAKIQIKNLFKSFGDNKVLRGVDLDANESKSLVIIGGSGSGKSVLIKIIANLLKQDSGSVKIIGDNSMGFLFQGGALFDSMSIAENIIFPLRMKKLNQDEQSDMVAEKLKIVGLSSDISENYPSELSGGMQKRVALARAIVANPSIIFFDEPTTGLDPIMANVINELIIEIKENLKATIVTITHDMHSARVIADDMAMLYEGKIIWTGKKKELDNADNPYIDQFANGKLNGPITV